MKNDKIKAFDTIEEAEKFISGEQIVVKGIEEFGKKLLVLYYTAEKRA